MADNHGGGEPSSYPGPSSSKEVHDQRLSNEPKRKRFQPFRVVRKIFRRKSKLPYKEDEDVSSNLKSRSTSELLVANCQEQRIASVPPPYSSGLSLSHDSIFAPESEDVDTRQQEKHFVHSPKRFSVKRIKEELMNRFRPRQDSDDDDAGLPHSPCTSPTTAEVLRLMGKSDKLRSSDGSLLSMGSSGTDTEEFSSHNLSRSVFDRQLVNSDPDLDVGATVLLNNRAALHKISIKPRRTHAVPQNRRLHQVTTGSSLPTTPEDTEEGFSRALEAAAKASVQPGPLSPKVLSKPEQSKIERTSNAPVLPTKPCVPAVKDIAANEEPVPPTRPRVPSFKDILPNEEPISSARPHIPSVKDVAPSEEPVLSARPRVSSVNNVLVNDGSVQSVAPTMNGTSVGICSKSHAAELKRQHAITKFNQRAESRSKAANPLPPMETSSGKEGPRSPPLRITSLAHRASLPNEPEATSCFNIGLKETKDSVSSVVLQTTGIIGLEITVDENMRKRSTELEETKLNVVLGTTSPDKARQRKKGDVIGRGSFEPKEEHSSDMLKSNDLLKDFGSVGATINDANKVVISVAPDMTVRVPDEGTSQMRASPPTARKPVVRKVSVRRQSDMINRLSQNFGSSVGKTPYLDDASPPPANVPTDVPPKSDKTHHHILFVAGAKVASVEPKPVPIPLTKSACSSVAQEPKERRQSESSVCTNEMLDHKWRSSIDPHRMANDPSTNPAVEGKPFSVPQEPSKRKSRSGSSTGFSAGVMPEPIVQSAREISTTSGDPEAPVGSDRAFSVPTESTSPPAEKRLSGDRGNLPKRFFESEINVPPLARSHKRNSKEFENPVGMSGILPSRASEPTPRQDPSAENRHLGGRGFPPKRISEPAMCGTLTSTDAKGSETVIEKDVGLPTVISGTAKKSNSPPLDASPTSSLQLAQAAVHSQIEANFLSGSQSIEKEEPRRGSGLSDRSKRQPYHQQLSREDIARLEEETALPMSLPPSVGTGPYYEHGEKPPLKSFDPVPSPTDAPPTRLEIQPNGGNVIGSGRKVDLRHHQHSLPRDDVLIVEIPKSQPPVASSSFRRKISATRLPPIETKPYSSYSIPSPVLPPSDLGAASRKEAHSPPIVRNVAIQRVNSIQSAVPSPSEPDTVTSKKEGRSSPVQCVETSPKLGGAGNGKSTEPASPEPSAEKSELDRVWRSLRRKNSRGKSNETDLGGQKERPVEAKPFGAKVESREPSPPQSGANCQEAALFSGFGGGKPVLVEKAANPTAAAAATVKSRIAAGMFDGAPACAAQKAVESATPTATFKSEKSDGPTASAANKSVQNGMQNAEIRSKIEDDAKIPDASKLSVLFGRRVSSIIPPQERVASRKDVLMSPASKIPLKEKSKIVIVEDATTGANKRSALPPPESPGRLRNLPDPFGADSKENRPFRSPSFKGVGGFGNFRKVSEDRSPASGPTEPSSKIGTALAIPATKGEQSKNEMVESKGAKPSASPAKVKPESPTETAPAERAFESGPRAVGSSSFRKSSGLTGPLTRIVIDETPLANRAARGEPSKNETGAKPLVSPTKAKLESPKETVPVVKAVEHAVNSGHRVPGSLVKPVEKDAADKTAPTLGGTPIWMTDLKQKNELKKQQTATVVPPPPTTIIIDSKPTSNRASKVTEMANIFQHRVSS